MGLHHLAEAQLRLEYKIDLIMRFLGMPTGSNLPMHFIGQSCPACGMPVDYQVDIVHNVVTRRCGCKTGKIPSTFQLVPVQGTPNGKGSTPDASQAATGSAGELPPGPAKNRSRGPAR